MLRRSQWPLPAEVYDMIYSHLSLNHLAAIQKTCRVLFSVTCPYVWRSADMESLLQLLPSCIREADKVSKLEITTPSPIPSDYFDRFFHYARFVKCIKITPQFVISGSFEENRSEVAILASTTDHFILPQLRTVHLAMLHYRRRTDSYADYKFWMDALIPNSIQHISFQSVWSNDDESLLQTLLSKAPELSRLEFAAEEPPPSFYKQIVGPDKLRNVQYLRYTGSIMHPSVLLWLAELPQLSSLELIIDPGDSDPEDPDEPFSLPEVTYPSDAFQALTTLKVFTSDHRDIADECNLLRQIWRTPMVKHLTCVEIKLSSPIYPGLREFDQLMDVLMNHGPKVSSFRLEASGQSKHFPEIPFETLSDMRRLPLHTLSVQSPIHLGVDQSLFKNLGGALAKLEDLDLGSTSVEISDVLGAHGYLPRLRYLNIGVWQTKTSKKKLERSLFSKSTALFVCPTRPPGSSNLSLCFRERKSTPRICAYNLDFFDVDLLAILLATRWASIHVHGDLPFDRTESLRTRIDRWRCRADRNWDNVVDTVLLLLNRSHRR